MLAFMTPLPTWMKIKETFLNKLWKVENDKGGMLFIDTPGGTGKTYMLNLITEVIKQMQKDTIVLANSGIAATLL